MRATGRRTAVACLLLALAGCTMPSVRLSGPRGIVEPVQPGGWETIATPEDAAAIAGLSARWTKVLAGIPTRLRRHIAAEGALLDPAGALVAPATAIGPYHCRLVRIGGAAGYRSFAPDVCYVDGDAARRNLTKASGRTLPGGWLYPDGDKREVFLGAMRAPDAVRAPAYGEKGVTQVAGVVERVAPFRWRFVPVQPGPGGALEVYELIPITPPMRSAQ